MTDRILLSGATGFIAGHTIAQLLTEGHTVVGTVRNPDNEATVAHLKKLPGAAERLQLVAADLTKRGAFDTLTGDVDYVIHMASPYSLTVADPQRDLVDPAVNGTLSMLSACAASERVRRVVLTSSMAAVTDEPDSTRTLNEDDWNDKSSLTRNPYYFSKVSAERAAWDFVAANKPAWDLIAINPFLVVGPSLTPGLNQSNKVFADMLNGEYPAIMALSWGLVDVRDVARAHVAALTATGASGRYLCAAEVRSMRQTIDLLRRSGYGGAKLPRLGLDSSLGIGLAKFAARFQPKGVASYLRTHLGRTPYFDNSKIKRDLGLEFRDVDQTILDACADLAQWQHAPAAA